MKLQVKKLHKDAIIPARAPARELHPYDVELEKVDEFKPSTTSKQTTVPGWRSFCLE